MIKLPTFALPVVSGFLLVLAACAPGDDTGASSSAEGEPSSPAQISAPDPAEQGEAGPAKGAGADAPFIPVDAGGEDGAVIFRLPAGDEYGVSLRLIHTSGVTAGLGSNPVGLDRGYQDAGRIIAFRRVGDRVLIEEENWRYRANTDNRLERQAVLDSFARSVLWAGKVSESHGDGSFSVDIAGFLTGDPLNITGWLKEADQGDFAIDKDRSMVDPSAILTFPDNVEIDAIVTFSSAKPGSEVVATAPDGRSVTLTIHHSFVRLPPPGYEPRLYDPRSGAIDVAFYNFSSPLAASIVTKFARRFRLEKTDPDASSSAVKKPIVFYVDAGAPQAVRDALVEGASWWAEAFEAAGFRDAFRVEILPENVHPFDVRYNVIQWTHRQTRGWSYGGGVVDPRTGEMIKGHVILGSQRVRQDRMIFEGLAGAEKSGSGETDDPVQLALARIRQLSAHEVGHPLGFEHNFAASQNDRASVMDYPAPLVTVGDDGALDLSRAYASGIGDWDKFTVAWLYSSFPESVDEDAALESIIREAYGSGLKFVSDDAGRSVGAGHPDGSVWDNGDDPVAMLADTLQVREIALSNFGPGVISEDRPISTLRSVIVPIYLYHRYQVAAAAKLIGGYRFDYAIGEDGRAGGKPVPAARQRAALEVLIATLAPEALDLPDSVLDLLTPGNISFASFGDVETFESGADPMFDLLAAADASVAITMGALLHPARLSRLAETERRNGEALTIEEVLFAIERQVFLPADGRLGDLQRTVQARYVGDLISRGNDASPVVQSRLAAYLRGLQGRIEPGMLAGRSPDRAQRAWLAGRIKAHLERPAPSLPVAATRAEIPPGSPIGAGAMETCWHCNHSFQEPN